MALCEPGDHPRIHLPGLSGAVSVDRNREETLAAAGAPLSRCS